MRFSFGETVPQYDIKVFNEREVRAASGILLLFAGVSFAYAFLLNNFFPIKVTVIAFLIDFSIRLFIDPRYSPTLIMGRYVVRNQTVEYVGAPQKRFAWGIGFGLALMMFYFVIIQNTSGPLNFISCVICLTFLFLESSFGICLGCIVYGWFNKEDLKLCPGNVCEPHLRQPIQKINWRQSAMVLGFVAVLFLSVTRLPLTSETEMNIGFIGGSVSASGGCAAPEWAVTIGHEQQWEEHNCQ